MSYSMQHVSGRRTSADLEQLTPSTCSPGFAPPSDMHQSNRASVVAFVSQALALTTTISNFSSQIPSPSTIRTRIDTMPPKKNVREPAPSAAATTQAGTSTVGSVPPTPKPSKTSGPSTINATNWDKVVLNIYDHYITHTPQRTKLLDVFLGFLVVVGALQFLYCILAGNYVRVETGETRRTPLTFSTAVQCFPFWLLRYCRAIRSHR